MGADKMGKFDTLSDDGVATDLNTRKSAWKRPSRLFIVGSIALFVLIVAVLGLGLGLGVVRHLRAVAQPPMRPTPPPLGSPLPGAGSGATVMEDWRRDPSDYVLDMNWDVGAPPTTRHYNLIITEGVGWPDGVVRDMLFINGKFPGPVIELNRGDRLVVNVTNGLRANATTMHWHGILQNGTSWYDGVHGITQCGIPAGQSFVYNFTVDKQYGTFWYHSHFSTQYLDGILGPLVVHAPEEAEERKSYDEDRLVLIQDWYHDFSTINIGRYLVPNNENTEPVPDNGLINGQNFFNCSLYDNSQSHRCFSNGTFAVLPLKRRSKTRLRLINTGAFAEFEFSIDNHTLSVIEADGTPTLPHSVHRMPVHVGQRYSVVVAATEDYSTAEPRPATTPTATYWVRARMNTFCMAENPVLNPSVRAVLAYYDGEGGNAAGTTAVTAATVPGKASIDWGDAMPLLCKDLDDGELVPAVAVRPPPATRFYRVDFAFGIGDYQMDYAMVNGTIWAPLDNSTTLIQAADGLALESADGWRVDGRVDAYASNQFVLGMSNSAVEVVDVLLYSLDEGAHPFHLHGHAFWILQTGSGPFNWTNYYENIMPSNDAVGNPIRRDTLTVQSFSWSLIRFVADNPGLWAFHCHVAWHMEAGMMMQFLSRANVVGRNGVPDEVRALCPSL